MSAEPVHPSDASPAMSMADFRGNMREVLDSIESTHRRVRLTRRGHVSAVILSVEDLEALEETLDILHDPELVKAIRAGAEDLAKERTHTLDEVRRELGEQ